MDKHTVWAVLIEINDSQTTPESSGEMAKLGPSQALPLQVPRKA